MAEKKFNIPIARPLIGDKEAEAAKRPILSGWVTQGPEVAAFEKEFALFVGAEHACAVSSCTTGLHLALLAADVGPGDEVITASHSFIATANSVSYCGAKPVFVDIDPITFNMDPALIEQAITDSTRAILCIHQMGMPCDLEAIIEIGRRHQLVVIEDAACAIGSEVRVGGRREKIGKPHGDVACFSFHPRKVITTGDGGMITTSNSQWDEKFKLLRQQGMSVPDTTRHTSKQVIFESYPVLGYNYRMTDIQAAIGREQLKRLPEIIEKRRDIAQGYHKLLADIPGLVIPEDTDRTRTNWQSFCVRLPDGCDQVGVMQYMLDRGVSTRRGIMCSHLEEPYSDADPGQQLTESEKARDRCILLPLFPQMTEEEQGHVAKALKDACK